MVPEHWPDQPAKCDPVAAVAVRVTSEAKTNGELQRSPQLMPAGELETVPRPVPVLLTMTGKLSRSKTAVTAVEAARVTVQAPVPEQAPVQALNFEPGDGLGVSVTLVFQS